MQDKLMFSQYKLITWCERSINVGLTINSHTVPPPVESGRMLLMDWLTVGGSSVAIYE